MPINFLDEPNKVSVCGYHFNYVNLSDLIIDCNAENIYKRHKKYKELGEPVVKYKFCELDKNYIESNKDNNVVGIIIRFTCSLHLKLIRVRKGNLRKTISEFNITPNDCYNISSTNKRFINSKLNELYMKGYHIYFIYKHCDNISSAKHVASEIKTKMKPSW